MIRAVAKGTLFGVFGLTQRSSRFYRTITREWMGSQATHVDKLQRVWPGYVDVWRSLGIELDSTTMWIHEGGWTPFPFLANYMVTGSAGIVTNHEGRMLDRYLARAVNGALVCSLQENPMLVQRRRGLEPLRWATSIDAAVSAIGGTLHEDVALGSIPIDTESVDVCHSGGTLEHYVPADLRLFLSEARRILRPGGTMSHVFDHRDHLHHADARWPFLRHYSISDPVYRVLCGNPLLYHNRLLPGEVITAFETAGFELIELRRMMLPSKRYVVDGDDMSDGAFGIERSRLASRFTKATDDDLRTAAAHYLFRKPG